jgi:nucleotide-binding universal stress UspA family protein
MPTAREGRKIVVGVDFDEPGSNALREGMRLARLMAGAELHVVHVLEVGPDLHDARMLEVLSGTISETIARLQQHVIEVCSPPRGEEPFSHELVVHVRLGTPATAIHQCAVDVDADMIVVGTHGRSGVQKWLLGSVAEALVRDAHLPVLVAHPKAIAHLERSPRVEPPRVGQDPTRAGMTQRVGLTFRPRSSHISGLI